MNNQLEFSLSTGNDLDNHYGAAIYTPISCEMESDFEVVFVFTSLRPRTRQDIQRRILHLTVAFLLRGFIHSLLIYLITDTAPVILILI